MKWRAVFDDGSDLWDGPGAYPRIDRTRLQRFEVYPDDSDVPLIQVAVMGMRRLVYRLRTTLRTDGTSEKAVLVALESLDRRRVDLWYLVPENGGVSVTRQQGYAPHVPPELKEEEK